ncbi:DUF1990 family protein [Streptomyces poonensis]|uniref:DUF1990 domain-containing protein n=1 Tax=Streptomyces poonensis TaxID=68255 RepID=A0A918UC72_9ACTN|nr:DUF1990 domain-containing protein [Streptomyces poonensis]GGY87684.1 DUF1990 domain-containing protein [Streptomyces poonensis]GLJ90252.1 DUF1990 domain-containing protein [Streptomyces poonensis]
MPPTDGRSSHGPLADGPFTYAPVGATRTGGCPPGFHPLHVRTRIGEGTEVFERAAQAVMTWELHRAVGVGIEASAPEAKPGVDVTVTLAGVIKAPCRVVWTVDEPRRRGWAYGTLPGHPECGEDAFVVDRTGDGTVWLTVTAFSRAAKWYARAGGAATRGLQHAYARRCGAVLRRLCATSDG